MGRAVGNRFAVKKYFRIPPPGPFIHTVEVMPNFEDVAKKLQILVLGHNDASLKSVSDLPFLKKINLGELPIGKLQNNQYAEGRIYMSNIPSSIDAEYIGFATHRWNEKFNDVMKLQHLYRLCGSLSPQVVYCPRPAENWVNFTFETHKGIEVYLQDVAKQVNLPFDNSRRGFWSNCFICSKELYMKFESFFWHAFGYLHDKYGDGGCGYHFESGFNFFNRKIAIIFERLTPLFFSHQNVVIRQIPLDYTELGFNGEVKSNHDLAGRQNLQVHGNQYLYTEVLLENSKYLYT